MLEPRRLQQAADHVPDNIGANLFHADPGFDAILPLYLPADLMAHLRPHLERLGAMAGGRYDELAGAADRNPPTLSHRTRTGRDLQRIDKHPAFVELERAAYSEYGLAALSHRGGVLGWPDPMPPAAKYALTYLFVQAEFGLCCPVSMTDSLARTLRKFGESDLVARHLPALTSLDFDALSQGAMFMTEQGAGSDVGATATRAWQDADGQWHLEGDKWFCSNPDAGLAMVLARPEGGQPGTRGLTLFLLPRLLEDGSPNHYRILRLKDKLGTRSMASGEIRLEGAVAYPVGDLGRGFLQMTDMINNSRLSNGVRAAGLMRRALTEALFIARNREAFGKRLVELPLMQRQLAKIMVWTEQARSVAFQTAAALQRADAGDEESRRLLRMLTPLLKFRACRDARKVTGDAMEVRGGCGYIEEWSDARLLRDAHLGSIWEGTSNIVALDVIRSIRREDSLSALERQMDRQLQQAALPAALDARFRHARARVSALAAAACARENESLTRQAASALYHLFSATTMASEARRADGAGAGRRLLLAQLVLRHRVLTRDPLAVVDDSADWLPKLLSEAPIAFEQVPVLLSAAELP
jgi:alkylation response protein AidB-like acyl-CoA dehydrogenase